VVDDVLVPDPEVVVVVGVVVVFDPEVVVEPLVVAGVELDAVVDAVERLASAGSFPDTSTTVIRSQLATNSASAPAMMRRRIVRARANRARPVARPRGGAPRALVSVMVRYLVVDGRALQRAFSFEPARINRVRQG
jgi:hypothetical protein